MVDLKELVKAGVQFGHKSSRWCPRMAPYIWGVRNNIHLINVAKTAQQLEKACKALEGIVAEGKNVLWIGTKKPAQAAIRAAAEQVGMPYVTHRWIGGTLTNNSQVKKSVTKYLHLQDVLQKADRKHYTKKEFNVFQKMVDRLEKNIGGILNLQYPVGALIVVDVNKEASAVKEAATMGVPVIALVDTNSDPLLATHVIPSNDDSPRAIKLILDYLVSAAERGKTLAKERKADEERELELLREKKKPERKEAAATASKKEAAPEQERSQELQAQLAATDEAEEVKPAAKKAAPRAAIKRAPAKKTGSK